MDKMSKSEEYIMEIIWNTEAPVTSAEIFKKLPENKWKMTTLLTLASRLIDKGYLRSEKSGRIHQYYPVITKDEYIKCSTKEFLNEMHKGSLKSFFASLYSDGVISQKDMDELKEILLKKEM